MIPQLNACASEGLTSHWPPVYLELFIGWSLWVRCARVERWLPLHSAVPLCWTSRHSSYEIISHQLKEVGIQRNWDSQSDWITGVQLPSGEFSVHHRVKTGCRPIQSPIQLVLEEFSMGMTRLGRDTGHSPPSSAEVRNTVSCASSRPHHFMALHLIKHKENLPNTYKGIRGEMRFFSWNVHMLSRPITSVVMCDSQTPPRDLFAVVTKI
jgi:hypothetical protein